MKNSKNGQQVDPSQLTDKELYKKCQEYGVNAKEWKRKFAGLLPEVHKRKLYRKRNFLSIYEFAAKLGGMSKTSVDRVLRLSKKLENKPKLKEELTNGSTHWSKIEKVAYIATPKTEKQWVEKLKTMPQPALEIAVREERITNTEKGNFNREEVTPQGNPEPEKFSLLSFKVSPEVEKQLRFLKQQMEKKEKQNLTWNETFKVFFKENSKGGKIIVKRTKVKVKTGESRYIPRGIKQIIRSKHGQTCCFRGCNLPAETFHHTKRFAINPTCDPDDIVPLCKKHHQYVHSGLIEDETLPPEKWKTKNQPDPTDPKFAIDQKVQSFWQPL